MQQFWPVPKRETSPELILLRFIQEVGSLLRADIEPENEKRVFSNFGSGVDRAADDLFFFRFEFETQFD